jgi:hypothetical protein
MDQVFFRVPFASNGDTSTIPETVTTDGSVNWPQGWPLDYEKDLDADAHAKAVEREVMNFMFNAVTVALRQYQSAAFPEYITAADNNGTAFPYSAGTVVRYRATSADSFENYVSLVNNNTATPGADASKWQEFMFAEATEAETEEGKSGTVIISPRRLKKVTDALEDKIGDSVAPFILPVGAIIMWSGVVAPEGWLELNGQSFDTVKNPELAVQHPSGRVPDWRGYVPRGWAHGSAADSEPNREIGSLQEDAIQNITGGFPADIGQSAMINNPNLVYGAFYDNGPAGPGDKGNQNNEVRKYVFDASRVVRTATETRVKNVATMFIIKTDQAESDNNTDLPTAVVVSPSTVVIEQGKQQQCTASVLPASLASSYPVSWSVSDASLGSVNENGLYTATAGKSGTQTVIASISTGLTATVTITQHIFLESIVIGAIPELVDNGETYTPSVVFNPTNYSEPLEYSSADNAVASFSGGVVFPNGQGNSVLTIKGTYSEVTGSQKVTVVQAEVIEEFLRIESQLSEIADAGEDAQEKAREHLGLGELATKDSLSAEDVGAAPMASESLPEDQDLDELTAPGDYFQSVSSNATEENHYPEETAGAVRVIATGVSEGACRQFYWPYNSTKEYRRCGYGDPLMFTQWDEF